MEYKEIKQLMDDMGESKLNEIKIEFPDGTKIQIKKDLEKKIETESSKTVEVKEENVQVVKELPKEKEENCKYVTSPMVGTFYSKPEPTAAPYVEVGTRVKKGDKLCIIEAMKLMNEIESEYDGEIVEVLLKDGEMVDYGKKLFKIK